MQNARELLSHFLPNASGSLGQGNTLLNGKKGLATGLVTGGLAGLLMGNKKSRKMAKTAAKYGGAALLGGLAYRAYNNRQQANGNMPQNAHLPQTVPDDSGDPGESIDFFDASTYTMQIPLVIQAMVAAAHADGHIDQDEKNRISDELAKLNIASEHRAFVNRELSRPRSPEEIAKQVRDAEEARYILSACSYMLDLENEADAHFYRRLQSALPW